MTRFILSGMLALCMQGCGTVGYYLQSVHGQMEVMAKRRPNHEVMADKKEALATRESLRLVERLRRFAVDELALPDNGSYRSYSDMGRPYVLHNVFATPELSLQPVRSCFLIVGCLDYRGYFRESRARAYARTLRVRGYDVFVGGVAAYSTLGWFEDPVLNSMLRWDEARLARFLFHELAHQRLYVRNDTTFNEAFAETVAEVGLQRWLGSHVSAARAAEIRRAEQREQQFIDLVLSVRSDLERIYATALSDPEKRAGKSAALMRFRAAYNSLKADWNGDTSYDAWVETDLNNAKISAVVTYHDAIPAFRVLLDAAGNDLQRFYTLAANVGNLKHEQRSACLADLKHRGLAGLSSCAIPVP